MPDLVRQQIIALSEPDKVEGKARFFQTGAGQYAEGDQFLGIGVPALRKLSRSHRALDLDEIKTLLQDPYHEIRFFALLVMVAQFKKASPELKLALVNLYLGNTSFINNWDLVDVSCYDLLGAYCAETETDVLITLAQSESTWERRIAIVSTYNFIRHGELEVTLDVVDKLLPEPEVIVQKAIGWMLKEVGKRNQQLQIEYLLKQGKRMSPLTMRTALEKTEKGLRDRIYQQLE